MIRREYHGKVQTPEYRSWRGMIERCESKSHVAYPDYGGRGVRVCRRWRKSFTAFLRDMGSRPAGTTLERIKNDKGYSKSNCRWATRQEQARNKRNNRLLTAFGRTQTLAAWVIETGLSHATILTRLGRGGLSVEDALSLGRNERRKNERLLTCAGVTQSITAWASQLKTSRATIGDRLKRGLSEAEALTLPIKGR